MTEEKRGNKKRKSNGISVPFRFCDCTLLKWLFNSGIRGHCVTSELPWRAKLPLLANYQQNGCYTIPPIGGPRVDLRLGQNRRNKEICVDQGRYLTNHYCLLLWQPIWRKSWPKKNRLAVVSTVESSIRARREGGQQRKRRGENRGGIQWQRKWIFARRFCAACSRSVTI